MHLDGWTAKEALVADQIGLVVNFPRIPAGDDDEDKEKKEREKKLKTLKEIFTDSEGLKGDAIRPYARGEKPVFFRANGRREIKAAVEFAVELKLKPVIVGGREAWKCAELLKKHDVPVILGEVMSNPVERYDPYDSAFFVASRLHDAGVRFCLQTDDASNVRNLPYQAAVAAAYGLPRNEALKAVTIRAAQILGVADRLGTIEEGKVADLMIATGDPLEIVTDVVMVFIDGRPVSLENRHTRLYRQFQKRTAKDETWH
jgi:imidazolonepropionase-like amidohydrolase